MADIKVLRELCGTYQKLRNEGLATGLVINTVIGDFVITNEQAVSTILDSLIKELNDQIKEHDK